MVPFTAMNAVHPATADTPPALTPASAPTPASPRAIVPAPAIDRSPNLSPTSTVGNPHSVRRDHSIHNHQQTDAHYVHHPPPQSPTSSTYGHVLHHSPQQQHRQPHRQILQSTAAAAATSSSIGPHSSSPLLRQDTSSSVSSQAAQAAQASNETSNTSYSADTSPNLHQLVFSLKDGCDVSYSNIRRTSRRRTGPLSQASRERAALIRKLGACNECRKRRVACHPGHHNMTWEELQGKFRKSMSPPVNQELARPFAPTHTLGQTNVGQTNGMPAYFAQDSQDMEIDNSPADEQHTHHQQQHVGLPSLNDARNRTPLPGGRLEKSLSLPGIESLKNDLQTSVSRILSTGARTRYQGVEAVLILWEQDDDFSIVNGAVKELAEVFDQFYHYTFRTLLIPSPSESCKSPGRWLSRKLNDFVEDRDQRDVLKVVFYAGHSYLDGNRDMTLASSRDVEKAFTIRWSAIQQILEEACSDVLILMDAAYYPSSRMVRNRGVLELIAASVSEEHHHVLDRCSFTRALADLLRTRATRLSPLSAAELHAALLAAYPKLVQERHPEKETITSFPAPLHIMMSGNPRLPSIFLAPVYQGSPLRNSSLGGYDNNPQLHLTIHLHDDNVDVETWNEWLRLMPEGVRDVRVDGPFRPTYR